MSVEDWKLKLGTKLRGERQQCPHYWIGPTPVLASQSGSTHQPARLFGGNTRAPPQAPRMHVIQARRDLPVSSPSVSWKAEEAGGMSGLDHDIDPNRGVCRELQLPPSVSAKPPRCSAACSTFKRSASGGCMASWCFPSPALCCRLFGGGGTRPQNMHISPWHGNLHALTVYKCTVYKCAAP